MFLENAKRLMYRNTVSLENIKEYRNAIVSNDVRRNYLTLLRSLVPPFA